MFPSSLLLVIAPAAGAILAGLSSRWQRVGAVIGAGVAWGMVLWLTTVPDGEESFAFFGPSLLLTAGVRGLLAAVYSGFGLLLLLTLLWGSDRRLAPAGLAALSLLAVALTIRPFTFGVPFLLLGVCAIATALPGARAGTTHAALRYLLMMTIAAPLLLVAGWMLERQQAVWLQPAAWLLVIAIAILAAGFPFVIWIRPIATVTPLLTVAFLFGPGQLIVFAFLFQFFPAYPALLAAEPVFSWLRWSAILTMLAAGGGVWLAQTPRDLLGSLLALDIGFALLVFTSVQAGGWETAVILHSARFVSLLLIAGGDHLLYGEDGEPAQTTIDRYRLLPALLYAYGSLSLVGLPLTPGFSGRWSLLITLSRQDNLSPWLLLLIGLALAFATVALVRRLRLLFQSGKASTTATVESGLVQVGTAGALLLAGAMAAFPGWWIRPLVRLAVLFT